MHELGSADGPAAAAYSLAGGPGRAEERNAGRRALLADVFETRILPRLLSAHGGRRRSPPPGAPSPDGARAVAELARHLLDHDERAAFALFDALRGQRDDSALMLDVLAPVARRLGALWESDECDFVEVTIGVRRLGAMLRALSLDDAFPPAEAPGAESDAPRLLLLCAPGETHRLGADMAAELFRRDGWEVERGDETALARLAQCRFTAVGFSLACERYADALRRAIAEARAISANPDILVLAGGHAFEVEPKLMGEFDVDYAAADVQDARLISRTLLERRKLRPEP